MKFLFLVWSNLKRRKLRTSLTTLSIFVAFLLFGLLCTIRNAFTAGVTMAGADRLVYRVHWQPLTEPGGHAVGPVVERLGHHGEVLSRQHLQLWEFLEHSLVEAQAAGQLFTPPVRTTP